MKTYMGTEEAVITERDKLALPRGQLSLRPKIEFPVFFVALRGVGFVSSTGLKVLLYESSFTYFLNSSIIGQLFRFCHVCKMNAL